jgi:hypothetical protein
MRWQGDLNAMTAQRRQYWVWHPCRTSVVTCKAEFEWFSWKNAANKVNDNLKSGI